MKKPQAYVFVTITLFIAACCLCSIQPVIKFLGGSSATAEDCNNAGVSAKSGSDGFDIWNSTQVANAGVIVTVGEGLREPPYGIYIALATAMQESGLKNLSGGDRDSAGLFQQRPSQGWGTVEQVTTPTYASQKFYEHLTALRTVSYNGTRVPWQEAPLTVVAQAIQRSGYPNAYAKWEDKARALGAYLGVTDAGPGNAGPCPVNCPTVVSAGGQSTPGGGCLSGSAILARATTWLTAWNRGPVPYLSNSDSSTWFQGYRRDCSGYASMALGLAGPGLDTGALASRSTPIHKADLRAGDLLINPAPGGAGHVVIFDHWVDDAKTKYVAYEQSGDGGTHHRTIPYPYFGSYQMSPYRY